MSIFFQVWILSSFSKLNAGRKLLNIPESKCPNSFLYDLIYLNSSQNYCLESWIYLRKHTGNYLIMLCTDFMKYLFQIWRDVRLSWQCFFSVCASPAAPGSRVECLQECLQDCADLLQNPKQFSAATWQVSGVWRAVISVREHIWEQAPSRELKSLTARKGFSTF